MEGMLENLMGGGVNGSGNPDGRGALNLKIHLSAEKYSSALSVN